MIEVCTTQVPYVFFDCPCFERLGVLPFYNYKKELILWWK